MINPIDRILLQNKAWAHERLETDPAFFKRLATTQKPEILWIGCSDSRVPANEITNTGPGEIFVHRNIANLATIGDPSATSVLEYAVGVLKVNAIIVCGHHGCGGIRAAMSHQAPSTLEQWLEPIREVQAKHTKELAGLPEGADRENTLLRYVVRQQVENIASLDLIQRAWAERKGPSLHGIVYAPEDGHLKEIVRLAPDLVEQRQAS